MGQSRKHHGVDGSGQGHHCNGRHILSILPPGPFDKHSVAATKGFLKITASDQAHDVLLPIGSDVSCTIEYSPGSGDGSRGTRRGHGFSANEPKHGGVDGRVRVVGGEERTWSGSGGRE